MKHLLWTLHDLVHNFEGWMFSYFTIVALSALAISAVLGYLKHSHKPALVTYVTIMVFMGAWFACGCHRLEWNLYFLAMDGHLR